MTPFLIIDTALVIVATYLDITSTNDALRTGAVEVDRLYKAAGDSWRLVRVVVSAIVVLGMWAAVRQADGFPIVQWAAIVTVAFWSAYVFRVVAVNRRNARSAR